MEGALAQMKQQRASVLPLTDGRVDAYRRIGEEEETAFMKNGRARSMRAANKSWLGIIVGMRSDLGARITLRKVEKKRKERCDKWKRRSSK